MRRMKLLIVHFSSSPFSSLTVTDTDVQPEAKTLRTAQPLILVFAVSLGSNGDLTCLSLT